MSESTAANEPTPSPCIGICRMDTAREFCTGCFRTREEIGCWQLYSEADKQRIVLATAERRAANINASDD